MDANQSRLMRSAKLRVVNTKMTDARNKIPEAYEKNRGLIDERIRMIVSGICMVQPVVPDALLKTIHHVIDSLFYKRPSAKVIQFLDTLTIQPPEVIYDAMVNYSMYLVDSGCKKKSSTQYFNGFVKKSLFEYKKQRSRSAFTTRNEIEDLPDDL